MIQHCVRMKCDYVDTTFSRVDCDLHIMTDDVSPYGVALVSRIDKMIGLFCKTALKNRQYSANET